MDGKPFCKWIAACFTLADVAGWIYLHFMSWNEKADFDILGVGWFLTNLPQVVSWLVFYALCALTIYLWCFAFLIPEPREFFTD